MSIHVCKCTHNGQEEFHLRYPGLSEGKAQNIADAINGGKLDSRTPEGCKLIAYDTGDGLYIGVENRDGDEVAMLAWPESWPESVEVEFVKQCGFKIV